MEHRVAALEEGMKEMRATLKELRDGQHKAEVASTKLEGDLKTGLAEISGRIATQTEVSAGLRRDLDRLPSKFEVATIMTLVIGGLGAVATLAKTVLPHFFGG